MNKLKTLKGFRDFLPVEARKRQYVIDILRRTFESYGFEPLETPSLEYEEVLSGKYGEEGQKLMYRFKDQGGRDVAMRYDQTVPLARVVAQYANDLPLPFRRYQIQNVWRAENTQKGRYREFLQADIDIVGTENLYADAEAIKVILDVLKELGVKNYKVMLNDRAIFQNIPKGAIVAIDKLQKIGEEGVIKELISKGAAKNENEAKKLVESLEDVEATHVVKTISMLLNLIGVGEGKVLFSPTLARGLDYYTGSIFEIQIEGYSGGSVAGGGRYDNLIGMFGDKQIPAVGGSFGFDRLVDALEELDLFPSSLLTSKVLVTIPSKEEASEAIETANKLRGQGINTEVYPDVNVGIDKQLKYADKKKIPFVALFEGEKLFLKDMSSGEKSNVSFEELIKKIS